MEPRLLVDTANDGDWAEEIIITNTHRWIIREVLHWTISGIFHVDGVPSKDDVTDYAIRKCHKNDLPHGEIVALLQFLELDETRVT